jgi:hypothetical protein
MSDMRAKVAGMRQPRPRPEMARMTSSWPKLFVRPQNSVQKPHRPVPRIMTLLRDRRSAAKPQKGADTACSRLRVVPMSPRSL